MDIWARAWDAAWARARSMPPPNLIYWKEVHGPKIVGWSHAWWRPPLPIWGWGHIFSIPLPDVGAIARWVAGMANNFVGGIAVDIAKGFVQGEVSKLSGSSDGNWVGNTLKWIANAADVVTFGTFKGLLNGVRWLADVILGAGALAGAVIRGALEGIWGMISNGFSQNSIDNLGKLVGKYAGEALKNLAAKLSGDAGASQAAAVTAANGLNGLLDVLNKVSFGLFGGAIDFVRKLLAVVGGAAGLVTGVVKGIFDVVAAVFGNPSLLGKPNDLIAIFVKPIKSAFEAMVASLNGADAATQAKAIDAAVSLNGLLDILSKVSFGLFDGAIATLKKLLDAVVKSGELAISLVKGIFDGVGAIFSDFSILLRPNDLLAIVTKPVMAAFKALVDSIMGTTSGDKVSAKGFSTKSMTTASADGGGLLSNIKILTALIDTADAVTFGLFKDFFAGLKSFVTPIEELLSGVIRFGGAMLEVLGVVASGFIGMLGAIITDPSNLSPEKLGALIQNYIVQILDAIDVAVLSLQIKSTFATVDDNYMTPCDHVPGWQKAEMSPEELEEQRRIQAENNTLGGIIKNIGELLAKFIPHIWNPFINLLAGVGNVIVAGINFFPIILSVGIGVAKAIVKEGFGILVNPGRLAEILWDGIVNAFNLAIATTATAVFENLLVAGKAFVTLVTQILPTSDTFFGEVVKEVIKLFGNVLAIIPQILVNSDIAILKDLGAIGVIIANGLAEYAGFFVDHFLMWGAELVSIIFKLPANGIIDALQIIFGETEATKGMNFLEKLGFGLKTLWQIPGKMIAYELNALRCHIDHDIDALALAQPMRGAQGIATELLKMFGVPSDTSNAIADGLFGWYNDVLHGWFNQVFVEAGYDALAAIVKAVWDIDVSGDYGYQDPSLAPGGCYCDVGVQVAPMPAPVEPPVFIEPPVIAPQEQKTQPPPNPTTGDQTQKSIDFEDDSTVEDNASRDSKIVSRMLEQVRLLQSDSRVLDNPVDASLVIIDAAPAPLIIAEAPIMGSADMLISAMAALDADQGSADTSSKIGVGNIQAFDYKRLVQPKA